MIEDTQKERYVNIPVYFLKYLHLKPQNEVFDNFIKYGVYINIPHGKMTLYNSIKSVLYSYFRSNDLPHRLRNAITLIFNELYDEDYEDWRDYDNDLALFDANGDISEHLIEEFISASGRIHSECLEFARVKAALLALNLTGSVDNIIVEGKTLHQDAQSHTGTYGTNAFVGLKLGSLLKHRDNITSQQELEMFAGYAAIRSLIGKKTFVATTKEIIASRMVGAKNKTVLNEILNTASKMHPRASAHIKECKKLAEVYLKYSTKRRQYEKLINTLLDRKLLSAKIGYGRRLYLSITLTYESLEKEVVKFKLNSPANKKKQRTIAQKASRARIKDTIESVFSKTNPSR